MHTIRERQIKKEELWSMKSACVSNRVRYGFISTEKMNREFFNTMQITLNRLPNLH